MNHAPVDPLETTLEVLALPPIGVYRYTPDTSGREFTPAFGLSERYHIPPIRLTEKQAW